MENTGIIPRNGTESDAKGFIFVLSLQPNQPSTGLLMLHLMENGVQFIQLALGGLHKSADHCRVHHKMPLSIYQTANMGSNGGKSRVFALILG
jgi:hypothetical protein